MKVELGREEVISSTILTWKTAFQSSRLPIAVERHLLEGDHRAHDHDFIELVVILGGKGKHLSASGEIALHRGVVLALRPGAWHGYHDCSNLELTNCCFDRSLLRHELRWLLEDERFATLFRGDRLHVLAPTPFEPVESALNGPWRTSLATAVGCLLHLLEAILTGTNLSPIKDRRIQSALHALEERPAYPWSISELAEIAGLAPATLSRRVRDDTGLSPLAYLTLIRCERAATLLRSSILPVGEIGERVGWPDQNYFARRFRQQYGLSPTAYRLHQASQ